MKEMYFDIATAILAAISAYLWAKSARVDFNFGYDMGQFLNEAMKKASKLNAHAAGFAAAAAVAQVLKPAWGYFFGFAD